MGKGIVFKPVGHVNFELLSLNLDKLNDFEGNFEKKVTVFKVFQGFVFSSVRRSAEHGRFRSPRKFHFLMVSNVIFG